MMEFKKIEYCDLNHRQKESYNYQKLSGLLAEYGYITYRMHDDYNGADFHAVHIDGHILKVQLKGRFEILKKYRGKGIHIAFPYQSKWFLYPHDEFYDTVTNRNAGANRNGGRSTGRPSKFLLEELEKYEI